MKKSVARERGEALFGEQVLFALGLSEEMEILVAADVLRGDDIVSSHGGTLDLVGGGVVSPGEDESHPAGDRSQHGHSHLDAPVRQRQEVAS